MDMLKVKIMDTKKLKNLTWRKLLSAWICDCDKLISEVSSFSLIFLGTEENENTPNEA